MTPTVRTTSSTGDASTPRVEHQGISPSPSLIPDRSEIRVPWAAVQNVARNLRAAPVHYATTANESVLTRLFGEPPDLLPSGRPDRFKRASGALRDYRTNRPSRFPTHPEALTIVPLESANLTADPRVPAKPMQRPAPQGLGAVSPNVLRFSGAPLPIQSIANLQRVRWKRLFGAPRRLRIASAVTERSEYRDDCGARSLLAHHAQDEGRGRCEEDDAYAR